MNREDRRHVLKSFPAHARRIAHPWPWLLMQCIVILSSPLRAEEAPPPPRFIVIVNSYENPELASALFARTYENLGTMAVVEVGGQQPQRVYSKDVKTVIKVPELGGDLLVPAQFDEVARCLAELTAAVESFPLLRGQLLPLGTEMKTIVDSRAAGLVRRGGQWVRAEMGAPAGVAGLVLRDLSGREYRNVEIRGKEPDGLMVKHEGGVSKLLFTNLSPEVRERYGYDPAAAEAYQASRATAGTGGTSPAPATAPTTAPGMVSPAGATAAPVARWRPSNLGEVAECALIIENIRDGEKVGDGTGFLAWDGNSTVVYTNVHVVEGADSLVIRSQTGEEVTDIVSYEVAGDPFGYFENPFGDDVSGGDAVRIRLRQPRAKALTLAANAPIQSGFRVGITGNTSGGGVITKLEGAVTGATATSLEYDVATEPGNSGSPVVSLDTYEVVGLHTWGLGIGVDAILDYLWEEEGGEGERPQFKFGARLDAGARWTPTSLEDLKAQKARNDDLKRRIRLLCLLDLVEPRSNGILPDYDRNLRGSYTVRRILEENADIPVIDRLIRLDRAIKGADDGIRMSNVDLLKTYRQAMGDVLQMIGHERQSLGDDSRPYYYVMKLRSSRIAEISVIYEQKLGEVCAWYDQKLNVGGTIELTGRPRLPSLKVNASELLQKLPKGG
jgi:hypothetical protein